MTMPDFLRRPDREYRDRREWVRDAYARRGAQDRPLLLNTEHGPDVLDMDTAIVWAEIRAQAELA